MSESEKKMSDDEFFDKYGIHRGEISSDCGNGGGYCGGRAMRGGWWQVLKVAVPDHIKGDDPRSLVAQRDVNQSGITYSVYCDDKVVVKYQSRQEALDSQYQLAFAALDNLYS